MKRKPAKKKFALKGLSLRKNKKFFGVFAVSFALIIFINATLAWSSYSEWVKNHTQSNPEEVAVSVTETFEQGSIATYADPVEKSVKVQNMSKRPAIVRVKFSESFLPFLLDMSDGEGNGNGGLKTVKRSGEELISISDPGTWNTGSLLDSGKKDGSDTLYYQAADSILKNVVYTGESNRGTGPDQLKLFSWGFTSELYDTPQIAISTPYWVFDGTYFYYSKVLAAGETTAIDLLQSVSLVNDNVPNKYKNALYDIEVEAQGVTATQEGLKSWTSSAGYLSMYQEDPGFK